MEEIGPILLGCNTKNTARTSSTQVWTDLPRHKDEDQVRLDVDRSFIYYPKRMSIPVSGARK